MRLDAHDRGEGDGAGTRSAVGLRWAMLTITPCRVPNRLLVEPPAGKSGVAQWRHRNRLILAVNGRLMPMGRLRIFSLAHAIRLRITPALAQTLWRRVILFVALVQPCAAKSIATETCHFNGTTDYAGHVSVRYDRRYRQRHSPGQRDSAV